MATELEIRRNDKGYLFQALKAQYDGNDFDSFLAWIMTQMEPEDVKLVLKEFEEWKNG